MLPEYIDCNNKDIPFDVLMKSLLTIDDNGNVAIRIIHSADSEVPYVDCDNASEGFETMVRRAIVSVNGLPTLNMAVITPAP